MNATVHLVASLTDASRVPTNRRPIENVLLVSLPMRSRYERQERAGRRSSEVVHADEEPTWEDTEWQ